MTTLRTAAQQALDALVSQFDGRADAINILSAALEQPVPPTEAQTEAEKVAYCAGWWAALENARKEPPKQEPVAWMVYTLDGVDVFVTANPKDFTDQHRALALYPSPVYRKPLTEEEIIDAVRDADFDWQSGWTLDEALGNRFVAFARAIERAHGIEGSDA